MTTVLLFLSLVLGAVLQAVWPAWEALGQSKLPVLFAVVMYYAMTRKPVTALVAALFAGFLQDALSEIPLGYSSFVFLVFAGLIIHFRELIFIQHTLTHIVVGALGFFFCNLMLFILLRAGGHVLVSGSWLLGKMLGSLVLGTIAVPIFFALLSSVDRGLGHDPHGGIS